MPTHRMVALVMWMLAVGSAAGSNRLEQLAADRPAAPQESVYRTAGQQSLKAFVFAPRSGGAARPGILLFHGGAWNLGEASWVFERAREFAARGMVAVAIEYRLSKDGLSPIDAIEDTCAAFAWARGQAASLAIDPRRLAGYGVSAGGHLVAAAATLPAIRGKAIDARSRPDALVLFSPALNMAKDEYFVSLMDGKGDPALYSPAEFITRALPPTFIVQGEKDTIVHTPDARAFCESARRAGARCELQIYPGVGHILTRNLKVQYRDFDTDPGKLADAHRREDEFLAGLGFVER